MAVHVDNEVERLRQVVVHRPGAEIGRMTQHDLERLLFDDLLSPTETVREHDLMVEILRGAGAKPYEIAPLLRSALAKAERPALERMLQRVCDRAGAPELAPALAAWEPARLSAGLIEGIHWRDVETEEISLARLRARAYDPTDMALRPIPNLMFMRDPCITTYGRINEGRMATRARARESIVVGFALTQEFGEDVMDFGPSGQTRDSIFRMLEGGDVLVLSPRSMLIGCSERTSAPTIERFANDVLFPHHPELERIYAVLMPEERSVMHLDTIVTQVDRRLFLGHRPYVEGTEGHEPLPVVRIQRERGPALVRGASLLEVLREEIGEDVACVPCGGEEPLYQEREQWTDGANAVCVAPGHIILYARNRRTIEALEEHGFEEVRVGTSQSPSERSGLIRTGMAAPRVIFSFAGSELSRARGGGRCLTMPIERDPWTR